MDKINHAGGVLKLYAEAQRVVEAGRASLADAWYSMPELQTNIKTLPNCMTKIDPNDYNCWMRIYLTGLKVSRWLCALPLIFVKTPGDTNQTS